VNLLDSKTARFWLMLIGIAFVFICFVMALQTLAGVEVPLVQEFFNLLGVGGTGQTVRNVAADHVVPMMQQNRQPGNLNDPPV
jgi:cytochrome c oxidase assembly protein Cox11